MESQPAGRVDAIIDTMGTNDRRSGASRQPDPVLHYDPSGRHTYRAGLAPEHLMTRTQLRSEGLSSAGLDPAGWLHYSPLHGICPLFDKREARPVRRLSERQRKALADGREAARTTECHRCGTKVKRVSRPGTNIRQLCKACSPIVAAERKAAAERRHRQMLTDDRANAARWAAAALADPATVIVDTETTGFATSRIIEIAVVDTAGRELMNTLINPGINIEPDAVAVHGITDADVSNAPAFSELAPELERVLTGRRMITYNAKFDADVIRGELRRHWYADYVPTYVELRGRELRWAGGIVTRAECAMTLYAEWHGEWHPYHRSYTWQPLNGGHRAAGDCQAVLQRMRTMAASTQGERQP